LGRIVKKVEGFIDLFEREDGDLIRLGGYSIGHFFLELN